MELIKKRLHVATMPTFLEDLNLFARASNIIPEARNDDIARVCEVGKALGTIGLAVPEIKICEFSAFSLMKIRDNL